MSPANDNASGINPSWSHIELSGATVTDAYLEDAAGRHPLPDHMGLRFSVDAVDSSGGRMSLHSCASYDMAIALAEDARSAFEIEAAIVDLVGEGRQ